MVSPYAKYFDIYVFSLVALYGLAMLLMHAVGRATPLGEHALHLAIGGIVVFPLLAWVMLRYLKRTLEYTIAEQQHAIAALQTEISTHQQAAEALSSSEARFRSLFNNALDAILLADDNGDYVDANPAACVLLGYSRAELLGMNIMDVTPSSNHAAAAHQWRRLKDEGQLITEQTVICKNGQLRETEYYAVANIQPNTHLSIIRDITARTQAVRVQKQLASVVEQSEDAIISKSLDGTITSWNRGAERIYDYSAHEAIGQLVTLIIPPGMPDEFPTIMQKLQRGQVVKHYETQRCRKDGSIVAISLTVSPLQDAHGIFVGASAIARDITERKQGEEALRRSEERFRTLLETAPSAILVVDEAGQIVLVNAWVESMFGFARHELVGTPIERLLPDRFTKSHTAHRANFLAQPAVRPMGIGRDLAGRRSDGSEFPVEIGLSYTRTDKGILALAFITNITERKKAEEALATERRLLRAVIDNLPDYIFVKDTAGRFILSNTAHAASIKRSAADLTHMHASDLYPAELAAVFDEDDQTVLRRGTTILNQERQTLGADGSMRWVLTTKVPLRDAQGTITGLVGISRDISERKQAEEALRDSEGRLRLAMQIARLGIWDWDIATDTTRWSDEMFNIYGIKPEAFIGKGSDYINFARENYRRQLSNIEVEFQQGITEDQLYDGIPFTPITRELYIVRPDGSEAYTNGSAFNIVDETGQLRRMIGVTIDITEQKHAQEALCASEARYRAIAEHFPNGMIALYEHDLRYTVVNGSGLAILGMTSADVQGKRLHDVFPPDIYQRDEAALLAALRGEITEAIVPFGSQYFRVITVPVKNNEGRIISGMVMSQNITAMKQIENELKQTLDQLQLAINTAQLGIWRLNISTGHLAWNDQLLALYGISRAEFEESVDAWQAQLHPEDKAYADYEFRKVFAGEQVNNVEFRLFRPNGEIRYVTASGTPVYDSAGTLVELMGINIDITSIKQNEEVLRQTAARLCSLVETQSVFVMRTDMNANITYINDVFYERYQWLYTTKKAIIGASCLATVLPDEHKKMLEVVKNCIQNPGQPFQINLKKPTPDGSEFWTLWEFVAIQNQDGEMTEIQCIGFDVTEQKLNERKVIEQGNTLALSLQAASVGVWVWDIPNGQIMWDATLEKMHGLAAGTFGGTYAAWRTLIHPADLKSLETLLKQSLAGESQFNAEFRIVWTDGTSRYIWSQSIVIWDETTHDPVRMVGVNMDITERKRQEEHLRYQSAIYQSINDAVITLNLDHRIITWNDAAADLYGWSVEEALDQSMSQIIPMAYPYTTQSSVDQTFAETGHWHGEVIQIARDGNQLHVLGSLSRVLTQTGEAIGVVVVVKNITDLKQSQHELSEALERERHSRLREELFRDTAETLSRTLDFDRGLQQAAINLKTFILFDELVIHKIDQEQFVPILYHDGHNIIENHLAHDARFATSVQYALQLNSLLRLPDIEEAALSDVMPATETAPSDISAVPLVARGTSIGLLTVLLKTGHFSRDDMQVIQTFANQISIAMDNAQVLIDLENSYNRLREAQERMVHSTRLAAIGELAAGIAHQINNPLMTVIGDSFLLLKQVDPNSPARLSAEAITRAATRAGEVVHRLLDFSRVRTLTMTPININKSLERAIGLVRSQIEPHAAEIRSIFHADLPTVNASDDHLQDIWINLLLNARDAVSERGGGFIEIETNLNEEEQIVEVTIRDNGVGITADDQRRIFDPFYTTKEKGTGLGLAICADVIKQHNGSISVESQPGIGTTFKLQLPFAATTYGKIN